MSVINTAAFESLQRYEKLHGAFLAIKKDNGLHPYNWMLPFIHTALTREIEFMRANFENWEEKLPTNE
jgi:hypothetical protein